MGYIVKPLRHMVRCSFTEYLFGTVERAFAERCNRFSKAEKHAPDKAVFRESQFALVASYVVQFQHENRLPDTSD